MQIIIKIYLKKIICLYAFILYKTLVTQTKQKSGLKMQFSTLNESKLHQTLKTLYSVQNDAQTEVLKNGYVYDIFSEENGIIEIQTKNLAKLLPKIMDALERKIKITLVYPLPLETKILLTDEQGNKISYRKSPKKNNIYSIFRELTGIYPILLEPDFTLEIVEVKITEERMRTQEPVQSQNRRRRFRRNWIKTGKKLDEILETRRLKTKDDYLELLPAGLEEEFCAKNISELLKKSNSVSAPQALNIAHLIIWVFARMNLIEFTSTKNRSRFYKIIQE